MGPAPRTGPQALPLPHLHLTPPHHGDSLPPASGVIRRVRTLAGMEDADIWRMIDNYLLVEVIKDRIGEPEEPWDEMNIDDDEDTA